LAVLVAHQVLVHIVQQRGGQMVVVAQVEMVVQVQAEHLI
jgi:hypothetical protein